MKHEVTPVFVRSPPPPPEGRDRIICWEGNFGLIVTASDHKPFVAQYRGSRMSRSRIKKQLDLRDARKLAKTVLGEVAKGGDALMKRRRAAAASTTTLKAVADKSSRNGGSGAARSASGHWSCRSLATDIRSECDLNHILLWIRSVAFSQHKCGDGGKEDACRR